MTAALDIRGVRKTIGQVSILQDIDITLEKGEFLVLVGPSGSGKSTLLSCIAGLADVSGGQILIGGRDMTYVKPADRDIAVVFQSYALFPTMTVAENITFGMRVRKVSETERQAHLARVAAQLKIDHLLDRKPGQLSGGQRQRVAMARALVRDPELFLFDEPLSNLDAKLRVSMRSEIKRLHQALDASIVYVTHDQIEAMTLATRIAVLRDGRIQQIGTPADVYDRPANLFVADFMGSPPMNLIPARATAGEGGLAVRLGTDGPVLFDSAPPPALAGAADQPIVFGIRPETLALAEPGDDPRTVAEIAVDLIEPTGSDLYAMATVAGGDFVARLPARAEITAGQPARFAFDLSRACYFDPKTEARL